MKLKKFFKPLVTVSALSFMLMGCADDSSNSGGSTTPPPTAESVFTKFLTDFQAATAKNAETPVEFTTNTTAKPNLTVEKGEEVQYLVSLDDVMAAYYATFGIKGTSTTLLTDTGSGITGTLTQIKNYAKVDTVSATTDVPLTLTNGTYSLYTGMFALMNEDNVTKLDTALGELDKEIEAAKPTEGEVTTPDLTKIKAATVQKVVDLINGNMYKVAYNSPAQAIQDAFANAKPLTLKNGMAFNEGNASDYVIEAGRLSYTDSNPAIVDTKVVVFLDEFKNKLNGLTANTDKDTVKGATTLTNNGNLGITTDTASSNANTKKITYTPATEVVAGAKVTYVAILDATTDIDSNTDNAPFKVLNGKIATGATKAEVDAALALLSGKIYKVDYTVGTKLELVNNFKQAVADAVAGTEGATLQVTNLTLALNASNYEDTTTTTAANTENIYCFDGLFAGVDTTYTKYLQLKTVNGSSDASDVSTNTGVYKATSGDPSSTKKIDFTAQGSPASTDVIKAYCSKAFTSDDSTTFEDLVTTYNTTKNYDNLKALIDGLVAKGVIYGEVTVQ